MKVTIIGGGPAGLFAAYKLADKADVTIIDKGKDVKNRKCPSPDNCTEKCGPCQILCGVGGAGLFSDGKIIFSTKIGNNLTDVVGETKNKKLVKEVQQIFGDYGVKVPRMQKETREAIEKLQRTAATADVRFLQEPQTHVGTDKLVELIKNFKTDLEKKGVNFIYKRNVEEVLPDKVILKDQEVNYDKLIIAPGRVGNSWLEKIANNTGIEYSYNPLDVGVRVEVPNEITENITDLVRDMKFYIRTKTYNDLVRTFCTCPGGKVARETHEGFNLVNGHSASGDLSENTNFAFVVTMPLTAPLSNSNKWGTTIAYTAYELGTGKPILQRLGDLRRGKRSKTKNKEEFFVKPSLEDVVYGDISLVLPGRIMKDIEEGLEKLDQVIPGVANDSTLLYAPEIKFHGLKVKTNKYLKTNLENIYVAGDGAGLSRGIAGACCCGVLAAEGILKELKK